MAELEPRLFSFNNPAGACQSCDGLGVKQYFDANKVIVSDELSLSGGAIRGWDKRNFYYFQMLKSLADHYGFELEVPFASLSKQHQQVILNGTGKTDIEFKYLNDRGDIIKRKHPFEGILPNMERRYHETESNAVREELAKYLASQSCPTCNGSRLREEARHVFIGKTTLPEVVELSIGDCLEFFRQLDLNGPKSANRRKNSEGNSGPSDVFSQRWPELPEPVPQRRNLIRWRSPTYSFSQPDWRRFSGCDVCAGRTFYWFAPTRQRQIA